MTLKSLASAAWVVACALWTQVAWAQSCCTAGNPTEFAVVGACQHAAVAAQLGYQGYRGGYGSGGAYSSLDKLKMGGQDATLLIGGGWRPLRSRVQIQGALPLRWQERSYEYLGSHSSTGVGDLSMGLRWSATEDTMSGAFSGEPGSWLPFVDVIAGLKMPTGRPTEDSKPDLAFSDVMGDGAWQMTAGLRVLKYVTTTSAVGVGVDYSHPFEHDKPDGSGGTLRVTKGDSVELRANVVHLQGRHWSFGAFGSYLIGANARENAKVVEDSAVRHLRVGASVTRVLSLPNWESTLGVALDPWWQDGGRNVPFVGPSLSLGVRRNFM